MTGKFGFQTSYRSTSITNVLLYLFLMTKVRLHYSSNCKVTEEFYYFFLSSSS